jgi:hypothetical protein
MKEVLQYYHILYGVRTGMSRLMLGYSADSFEGNANSSQHPVCKFPTLWSSNRVLSACAWQTSQVQVHLLLCFFFVTVRSCGHMKEAWDRVQKRSRLGWFVMPKTMRSCCAEEPWLFIALVWGIDLWEPSTLIIAQSDFFKKFWKPGRFSEWGNFFILKDQGGGS